MSTNNGGWKPRKPARVECPSGQVVYVQRPGPEFTLRAGKVARTFTKSSKEDDDKYKGLTPQQINEKVFEDMDDDELKALLDFARELVVAMLVSPRLVHHPQPDSDQIGPDDIGDDFWFLFNYAMEGYFGLKVPVGDTEVEVKDLESFRAESGVSGDGVDSVLLPSNVERPDGDQGLVGSAGA